ncbi:hypothetical protein D9M70_599980 [compost metagenome]
MADIRKSALVPRAIPIPVRRRDIVNVEDLFAIFAARLRMKDDADTLHLVLCHQVEPLVFVGRSEVRLVQPIPVQIDEIVFGHGRSKLGFAGEAARKPLAKCVKGFGLGGRPVRLQRQRQHAIHPCPDGIGDLAAGMVALQLTVSRKN